MERKNIISRCCACVRQQFAKFGHLCTDLALTYLPPFGRSGRRTLRANLRCKSASNLTNQPTLGLNRCSGRPLLLLGRVTHGLLPAKAAFTLMEMLLVVLIVGILTAVALPMYQRAVYKSRFSKLMLPAKSLASANEAFFLANGEYSELPAQLDVGSDTAVLPDGSSILLSTDDTVSFVRLSHAEVPNARYVVYQQRSANFAGTTMCESLDSDDRATWLCSKGLNGTKVDAGNSGAEAGWSAYILTGAAGQNDQFAAIGGNNNEDPGEEPTDPTDPTDPQEPEPQTPQCEGDQPADIHAGVSGATGTASCVNGQWKYTWTGGNVYSSQQSNCNGSTAYACAGSTFSGERSYCIGRTANICADSIFSGWRSYCEGKTANACAGTTFSGERSYCYGNVANGCAGSTFSGQESNCQGYVANGCAGTTIQAGAYCYADTSGGCDGAKYGIDPTGQRAGIGSCWNGRGYCPTGVPLTDQSWDFTTNAMKITGWKGDCCNPAYMVSGECPSGVTVCGS